MSITVPDWVTYPDDDWEQITPEEAGLDPDGFPQWVAGLDVRGATFGGEDHTGNKFGTVLTRGGYLVHSWGDRLYAHHTASVGKALTWAVLGFAAMDGMIDPDEPINRYWTGQGELSHPHKHLTEGHHKTLTWRHLIGKRTESLHWGGFPMEIGNRWAERRTGLEERDAVPGVAEWANWTGDPYYDCYSHAEPGTVGLYSSAGFWRLGQALTHVWGRDIKDVVQERLFDRIGIAADRWDWYSGGWVKDRKYFYPTLPDSYTYLDPPYEIAGNVVRSGAGLGCMERLRHGAVRTPQRHARTVEGRADHRPRLAPAPQRRKQERFQRREQVFHRPRRGDDRRPARVQARHRDPKHGPGGAVRRPGQSETLTIADSERPVVTMR